MPSQTSETTLVSGSVLDAAMTVTLTDGSADIDLSSATIPRDYKGCKLTIKDSVGRAIVGWVYTDGAGTVQNIVSTKGGTTRNWAFKDGAFNTTDDYIYTISRVHVATVVASGSLAAGAGKLSLVNGTAFCDSAGIDVSSYADGKHLIVYADSSNKTAGGYLKAAGAGETLGANVLTEWTNSGVSPYDTFTSVGGDITSAIRLAAGYGLANGAVASIAGALYKVGGTLTLNSGLAPFLEVGNVITLLAAGANTAYRTGSNTAAPRIYQNGATNYALAGAFAQRVLTPSTSGSTLVTAKNGTTYNWLWQTTGFNPNTALTYKVYHIGY